MSMERPPPALQAVSELWMSMTRLSLALHRIQSNLGVQPNALRAQATEWLRAYA